MDIHEIRRLLRTKSIYEVPLRVTFYARVSSDSDEQLNSLENQIQYYTDIIRKNAAWTYVSGYVDKGISGASTKHRERFNQMIDDGKAGMFDLVITKELSRFARNTLDSILYTRELLNNGVAVFFQNDNINTLDEDSELRLTIMSGIAQDELRKLSSRVKFGHQQAIKNGVVLGNSRIFGYTKDRGRLVVDEGEAEMVRELFTMYATGRYSMKQIEKAFWDKGYRNHKGNKIAHTTMSGMIANPKYKGYYVGNKVKVLDLFTKKQKFLPPEEWVMFKDESGEIVPAIVSEELWDEANRVLAERSEDVKHRKNQCNHVNLLTGKLICTHCGRPFYRRDSVDKSKYKNSRWVCSGKVSNGSDSCPTFSVYEEELVPILLDVFNSTKDNTQELIEEYIGMFRSMSSGKKISREIEKLSSQIELERKKDQKLLAYNVAGKVSDSDYLAMHEQCSKAIAEAQERIEALRAQSEDSEALQTQIETMRTVLTEAAQSASNGLIDRNFVEKYIDKIFVSSIDENTMRLDIRIFSGRTEQRDIPRHRHSDSRPGQMSLMMCPERTMKFCRIDRIKMSHLHHIQYIVSISA